MPKSPDTQFHLRFAAEEIAVLDAIKAETGLRRDTDAIRYALRQYAKASA